ncbi:translin [Schizosaccharomyces japonicus yFS275]|uniref:Translin n=1 Tax=Schizosaccharomyces japonicus (strain yFS275 / FY16936) TaxID=402676 RepID=B6JX99_SCHJY|nr:translin [Schizosaccharomyces japonicus yFS275]EEB06000.1 translin [Schizosaccharomyces japonicus yFS275]
MDMSIFEKLEQQLAQQASIRDEISEIVDRLNEKTKIFSLYRASVTEPTQLELETLNTKLLDIKNVVKELSEKTSKYSFYKYHDTWSFALQKAITCLLSASWSGLVTDSPSAPYSILTLEQVGNYFDVPVYPNDASFHVAIEDYLHSLVSFCSELSRVSVTSVIHGKTELAYKVLETITAVHTAFQSLTLKNDSLRRRFDGIKYDLKRAEDVVYDIKIHKI